MAVTIGTYAGKHPKKFLLWLVGTIVGLLLLALLVILWFEKPEWRIWLIMVPIFWIADLLGLNKLLEIKWGKDKKKICCPNPKCNISFKLEPGQKKCFYCGTSLSDIVKKVEESNSK